MAKQQFNQEYVYGVEPDWREMVVLPHVYHSELAKGLYYYGNCATSVKKKNWAIKFLTEEYGYSKDDLTPIPDFYIERIGIIYRMMQRGFIVEEDHLVKIVAPIPALIEKFKKHDEPAIKVRPKPCADMIAQGEIIDTMIDKISNGEPYKNPPEILESLSKTNINIFIERYTAELKEINAVLFKKDKELVEAYTGVPTSVLRGYLKLYNDLLKEFKSRIAKVPRTPRKKKVIPKSRQVQKLNYLKKCDTLGINSINPKDIIGKRKLLVFNTKNRALMHITTSDPDGLGVKGSTLIRFDEERSTSKTIRKPDTKLKEFLSSSSVKATKVYNSINAVAKPLTGRINKHCLILKVY